jgi:sugar lactone lactonase YvrE
MKKVKLALLGFVLLLTINSCKKNEMIKKEKVWMVSTLAGSGASGAYADGKGELSAFSQPSGMAVDGSGNVFVADLGNHCIRKITPEGVVTTLAGKGGEYGLVDGAGTTARFNSPTAIAIDSHGDFFVADGNNCIRKITSAGVVSTFAGSTYGFADGTGMAAKFGDMKGVTIDGSNNLYVTDYSNNRIRKITPTGVVSTIVGNVQGGPYGGNTNGPIAMATCATPMGIAIDPSGNIYFSQENRSVIRKVSVNGVVDNFTNAVYSGYSNGPVASSTFSADIRSLACDAAGNIYVVDRGGNAVIRKITFDNGVGITTTLAGIQATIGQRQVNPVTWYSNGLASEAKFYWPECIAVDAQGKNVYVSDIQQARIRKISLEDGTSLTAEEKDKANWNKPKNWK